MKHQNIGVNDIITEAKDKEEKEESPGRNEGKETEKKPQEKPTNREDSNPATASQEKKQVAE